MRKTEVSQWNILFVPALVRSRTHPRCIVRLIVTPNGGRRSGRDPVCSACGHGAKELENAKNGVECNKHTLFPSVEFV
jgi:hypothetical protein